MHIKRAALNDLAGGEARQLSAEVVGTYLRDLGNSSSLERLVSVCSTHVDSLSRMNQRDSRGDYVCGDSLQKQVSVMSMNLSAKLDELQRGDRQLETTVALCEIRTQLQELTKSVESCQSEVSEVKRDMVTIKVHASWHAYLFFSYSLI